MSILYDDILNIIFSHVRNCGPLRCANKYFLELAKQHTVFTFHMDAANFTFFNGHQVHTFDEKYIYITEAEEVEMPDPSTLWIKAKKMERKYAIWEFDEYSRKFHLLYPHKLAHYLASHGSAEMLEFVLKQSSVHQDKTMMLNAIKHHNHETFAFLCDGFKRSKIKRKLKAAMLGLENGNQDVFFLFDDEPELYHLISEKIFYYYFFKKHVAVDTLFMLNRQKGLPWYIEDHVGRNYSFDAYVQHLVQLLWMELSSEMIKVLHKNNVNLVQLIIKNNRNIRNVTPTVYCLYAEQFMQEPALKGLIMTQLKKYVECNNIEGVAAIMQSGIEIKYHKLVKYIHKCGNKICPLIFLHLNDKHFKKALNTVRCDCLTIRLLFVQNLKLIKQRDYNFFILLKIMEYREMDPSTICFHHLISMAQIKDLFIKTAEINNLTLFKYILSCYPKINNDLKRVFVESVLYSTDILQYILNYDPTIKFQNDETKELWTKVSEISLSNGKLPCFCHNMKILMRKNKIAFPDVICSKDTFMSYIFINNIEMVNIYLTLFPDIIKEHLETSTLDWNVDVECFDLLHRNNLIDDGHLYDYINSMKKHPNVILSIIPYSYFFEHHGCWLKLFSYAVKNTCLQMLYCLVKHADNGDDLYVMTYTRRLLTFYNSYHYQFISNMITLGIKKKLIKNDDLISRIKAINKNKLGLFYLNSLDESFIQNNLDVLVSNLCFEDLECTKKMCEFNLNYTSLREIIMKCVGTFVDKEIINYVVETYVDKKYYESNQDHALHCAVLKLLSRKIKLFDQKYATRWIKIVDRHMTLSDAHKILKTTFRSCNSQFLNFWFENGLTKRRIIQICNYKLIVLPSDAMFKEVTEFILHHRVPFEVV